MKSRNLLLAATIACLALTAHSASAAVIYNNLGPGDTFTYPTSTYPVWQQLNGSYIHYAAPFTVPGMSNVPFGSAELGLFLNTGPNLARIELTTNTMANLPGSTLETINAPLTAAPSSSSIVTFTSATNPVLTAGATYWIIAEMVNGGSMATWAPNNTGTLGAALTRTPFGNGQWFNQGPVTPAMRINAKGQIPEPASAALAGMVVVGLLAIRRQRGRA